jgi:hypothetical protein
MLHGDTYVTVCIMLVCDKVTASIISSHRALVVRGWRREKVTMVAHTFLKWRLLDLELDTELDVEPTGETKFSTPSSSISMKGQKKRGGEKIGSESVIHVQLQEA